MAKSVKLSKEESIIIFNKIIECIKKQKKGFFVFKKLKTVHGWCEWDSIVLDYRKELIPTIIHECIHLIEPTWSETQVSYAEKRVINSITEDNVIELLMFFVKKL